jgi:hypothetical protein
METKFVKKPAWKLEGFSLISNLALSYLAFCIQDALSLNLILETGCPSFLTYSTSLSRDEVVSANRPQQLSGHSCFTVP